MTGQATSAISGRGEDAPSGGGSRSFDVVVVGAGPNGLAAAITLARAGQSVCVLEAADTVGGGARSAELTLPGYVHDVCSAIYPFARSSPFFRTIDFAARGVRFVDPPYALGHPLDDGSVALVSRDVEETAARLEEGDPRASGAADADAYRDLVRPLAASWESLLPDVLAPFHVPWPPLQAIRMARFGLLAVQSMTSLARRFRGERARAILAGCAAHSMLRLTEPMSGGIGLSLLVSAHALGWPLVEGGAGRIPDALAAELTSLGGEIRTGSRVMAFDDLPTHRVALFDTAPSDLLKIAAERLSPGYRRALRRFRRGPGIFKLDLAIDGEIPWRNPELLGAGTVHLGGTLEEIARSEAMVRAGRLPGDPFVLLAQQSLFDRSRAPEGGNTVWAYCHVPGGSPADMTDAIERQIERFAPGFRSRVMARHATAAPELEAYDANDVGGDINGGLADLGQFFTRPSPRLFDPYSTPNRSIYLCSSSTPPGGGVHGMCGALAARSALAGVLSRRREP